MILLQTTLSGKLSHVAWSLVIVIQAHPHVVAPDPRAQANTGFADYSSGLSNDLHLPCVTVEDMLSELQQYNLPDTVAVNWGQWHGPYRLPPERLVLCANGTGFLWKQTTSDSGSLSSMQQLSSFQITQLFDLMLTEWPQGAARKGEDGNFIWLLDGGYNLIVAPIMQARGLEGAIEEVKHGDLSPGLTFFGDNARAGPYRGVARFGGEFNLAGLRNGSEWLMHAKSGYTAYRVPSEKAKKYYNDMYRAGHTESEIARNFQRCVFRDIFRSRTPLTRMLCYLRRHFHIAATPGLTQQCDIRAKLVDGLPNLVECVPKDSGDARACTGESEAQVRAPIVHLVDWYAPGQDRCKKTLFEYEALLHTVASNIRTFAASQTSAASSHGGQAYAKSVAKKIRSLRKHACLHTEAFTQKLSCNVHGCLGNGFAQELKKVENSLLEGGDFEVLWREAMLMWDRCKSKGPSGEL